jgi:carbamoyl-phosphate synthase small subunit
MGHLSDWLDKHGIPGISGIDTRALTHRIREGGPPKGVIAVTSEGKFDRDALFKMVRDWPGLAGMDLVKSVSRADDEDWSESTWTMATNQYGVHDKSEVNVVALDYGCKHNILRCLTDAGMKVHVVPAISSADDILKMKPQGIFLSNGPGDPAATATYAAGEVKKLAETGLPIFGICIGHQLIAEAFGAKTYKMDRGHRGANHPVKNLETGKIEITSQNHGFAVDADSLPDDLEVSHVSLFDGSIEGLKHKTLPIFCVQYHPEASPGPHDSQHLFDKFAALIKGALNAAS